MDEFVVPADYQPCSRNACKSPAVATLSCNYMARRVSVIDLEPAGEPDQFHLCAEHLGRFRPPMGWQAEDLRTKLRTVPQPTRVSA